MKQIIFNKEEISLLLPLVQRCFERNIHLIKHKGTPRFDKAYSNMLESIQEKISENKPASYLEMERCICTGYLNEYMEQLYKQSGLSNKIAWKEMSEEQRTAATNIDVCKDIMEKFGEYYKDSLDRNFRYIFRFRHTNTQLNIAMN